MQREIFSAKDSVEGCAKTRFIETPPCRFMTLGFSHTPFYRLSWEHILFLIHTSKDRTIEKMRQCDEYAELAERYRNTPTVSPTETLFKTVYADNVLPQIIDWYRPENGLDVDIFLILDDERVPLFQIEIFPRRTPGEMSREHVSRIKHSVRFACPVGQYPAESVATFFGGELVGATTSEDRKEQWRTFEGCWKILNDDSVNLFVSDAAFSALEGLAIEESVPMVCGGFAQDCDSGALQEAVLKFTQSH